MNNQDEIELLESRPTRNLEQYVAEIANLHRDILQAQENYSPEEEAIAHECAAKFYLEWGKEKIAAVHMQDAYDCYIRSGLNITTENLLRSYPQLLQPIIQQRQQAIGDNHFDDELIATVSHEFRTSLNGILGMSEALLEEVFGVMNEKQLNAVSTIDRSGWYLLALINNMVDLSKIKVGKLELELMNVSVAELCNSSITFVEHHAIQKQIQLDMQVSATAGYIAVDFQRMRQVLINLISQAIDSTPAGGRVRLVVTRVPTENINAGSAIQFSVIDTSKEIPRYCQEQSPPSTIAMNGQRIGFGLMLVHPIVELHGGSLHFQSAVGRGSCVDIFLPQSCLLSDSPTHFDGDAARATNCLVEIPELPLILIVEDNELNINTISSYLVAKGYRPIVAQDGELAIKMAQKYHPDLIVMDIQMPGMDGIEAITLIREQPAIASIPIIALTALAMEGDREKCLAAGANEYLTKPVKLRQLNATIQQFLAIKIDNTYAHSDFLY
jgi:signal transduction histidine kinase/ActR/RegA family two-component response regulator